MLSIAPQSHSKKLVSWFPMFIPIDTPLFARLISLNYSYVNKGDKVVVDIWRRTDQKRVWYEWTVVSPIHTCIHNVNGKYQWIGL